MRHIVEPGIEQYLDSLDGTASSPRRDPVLVDMEKRAAELNFPIVGPQVGRLLGILARSTGARRILEMGSGYGYSAFWMARALGPDARILCTDLSEQNRESALAFLRRGHVADRVEFRVGDALEIARAETGPFDLIFNDIDKHDYPRSVDVALGLLRPGGLFITDNALWSGRVAGDGEADATTRSIREFNRIITTHPSFQTVILPIRDGLAICARTG